MSACNSSGRHVSPAAALKYQIGSLLPHRRASDEFPLPFIQSEYIPAAITPFLQPHTAAKAEAVASLEYYSSSSASQLLSEAEEYSLKVSSAPRTPEKVPTQFPSSLASETSNANISRVSASLHILLHNDFDRSLCF
ncbi:unnamed protein product [Protopolystoma xenopodis]|uniref:Uncharacterized protein n=1 Tax=Protopolystoma xenopodis TaxID=117903 RepID=A0A448WKV8_9PLAT|nr:unnamed protein product [Protopolystoma xenopodis]